MASMACNASPAPGRKQINATNSHNDILRDLSRIHLIYRTVYDRQNLSDSLFRWLTNDI